MKIIDAHTHIGNFGSWARFDFDLARLKEQMAEFDIEKTLLTGAGFHDNKSVISAFQKEPDLIVPVAWVKPGGAAELAEIRRQRHEEYRHGILLASRGETGSAFDHLDARGFIHESRGKYLDEAAESFLHLTGDGRRPLECIAAAPTHRECEMLTDKIREKMRAKGLLDPETEQQAETFRSWGWTKERIGDAGNYRPGMKIFFTAEIRGLGHPGQMAEVAGREGKMVRLTDGRRFYPSQFRSRIDVGEARRIGIAGGDIIRFTVNLKTPSRRISNGTLVVATGRKNEFMLLDHNREPLAAVTLPEDFRGFRYGWVTTSHSSQGMTAKNVVVAAEKMSGQAFYVACSRGRYELALHVPEKEFFRERLTRIPTERKLVSDLTDPGRFRGRAPILPPPPDQVIGSRLKGYLDNIRLEMRRMGKHVFGYIRNAVYQAFNHNIRSREHERNEQLRQEDRRRRAEERQLAGQRRNGQPLRREQSPAVLPPGSGIPGERSRREKEEGIARLVALTEERKRRSSNGFDR